MAQKTLPGDLPVTKRLLFIIPILLVLALALIGIWLWYDRELRSLDQRQQAIPVSSPTRIAQ
ncbi:MAG: hypothetical protein ABW019_09905 [Chitinophagaceae bacterium]